MVQRRVNRPLVLVVTLVVMVIGALGSAVVVENLTQQSTEEWVAQAQAAEAAGQIQRAMGFYRQAYATAKHNADLAYETGRLMRQLNLQRDAMTYFRFALNNDPGHKKSLVALLEMFLPHPLVPIRGINADVVEGWADALLKVEPDNLLAMTAKASLIFAQRDVESPRVPEGLEIAKRVVEKYPTDGNANFALAALYYVTNQPSESQEVMKRYVQATENDPAARITYAQYLAFTNQLKDASAEFEAAASAENASKETIMQAARFFSNTGQRELGRKFWEQVKQLDASSREAYVALARMEIEEQDPDSALELISQGFAIPAPAENASDFIMATQARALLMLERGRAHTLKAYTATDTSARDKLLSEAAKDLDQFTGMHPDTAESKILAGNIAVLRGNKRDAVKAFEEALALAATMGSEPPGVLMTLAQLYSELQQPGLALRMVSKVAAMQPNNEVAARMSAVLLMQLGRPSDAELWARQLVSIAEANDDYRRLLLNTLRAQNKMAEFDELARKWGMENDTQLDRQALVVKLGDADPQVARQAYDRLHRDLPQNAALAERFLMTRIQRGQSDIARSAMPEILGQFPANGRLAAINAYLTDPSAKNPAVTLPDSLALAERIQAYLLLYRLYGGAGQAERAFAYLDVAEQIGGDDPVVIEVAFLAHVGRKQWQKAEALLRVAAAKDMDGANGEFFRGRLLLAQDKAVEASATLQEALRRFPTSSQGQTAFGEALLKQGRRDEAIAAFMKAIELDPRSGYALKGLAIARMPINPDQAILHVRDALEYLPDDAVLRSMADDYADRTESAELRIAELTRRLEQNPGDVQTLQRLINQHFRQRDNATAEKLLRQHLSRHPQDLAFTSVLSSLLSRTGRAPEAEALLRDFAAKATEPSLKFDSSVLLARQLVVQAQFDKAVTVYDELVKSAGDRADVWLERGSMLRAAGRIDEALDSHRQALKLPTIQPQHFQTIVNMLVDAGKTDEARQVVTTFRSRYPQDDRAALLTALVAVGEQKFDEAITEFSRVLSTSPNDAFALWQRAQLRNRTGDRQAAMADLQTLKRVQPDAFEYQPRVLLVELMMQEAAGQSDGVTRAVLELEGLYNEVPYNSNIGLLLVQLYTTAREVGKLDALLKTGIERFPQDARWPVAAAAVAVRNRQFIDAERLARGALAISPTNIDAVLTLVDIQLRRSLAAEALKTLTDARQRGLDAPAFYWTATAAHLMSNNAAAATAEMDAAAEKIADRPMLVSKLGESLLQTLGDVRAVGDVLRRWQQQQSDRLLPTLVLLQLQMGTGQVESASKALVELQAAGRSDPKFPLVVERMLGVLAQNRGEATQARDLYQQVLKQYPDDGPVLNNLAFLLASDLNQPAEALPLIERALRVMQQNSDVLDTYGLVLLKNNRPADAERVLRQAVSIQPKPIYLYHLAQAQQARGDRLSARQNYQRAVQLAGDAAEHQEYAKLAQQALDVLP